jgi:predicted nucleic acid-binding protein
MNVVVDASVAIKWFLPETLSDAAERLLAGNDTLFAPDFLLVECGNIVWKKVRLGQMARNDGDAALDALRSGPIELWPTTSLIGKALNLAHAIDHPVYACLYLATAEAADATAVTADRRFFDRARQAALPTRIAWIADWKPGPSETLTD